LGGKNGDSSCSCQEKEGITAAKVTGESTPRPPAPFNPNVKGERRTGIRDTIRKFRKSYVWGKEKSIVLVHCTSRLRKEFTE